MNILKVKRIVDILDGLALVFGVYVLGKAFYDRMSLPPDVCPINNNQTSIYISIGLLAVMTIISIIVDRKYKQSLKKEE